MGLVDKIYTRFFVASGFGYAAYLKQKGALHAQGENCFISKAANLPDPYLTSLGNNVWLTSGCQLLCHDASVIMLNILHGRHYDRVAPIVIGDNVFLGNNVIVLPGVTIGSNVVVGAGAVVTKAIPADTVWAGNPARLICPLENYVRKIEAATAAYPWTARLRRQERHVYDPVLEKTLRAERVAYFFKSHESGEADER